jgi:hypothetical protein
MYERYTRAGAIRMTQYEAVKIQTALERAHANKLSIMGHGTMKRDGARFLAVNSVSEPNTWHVVFIRQGRLECDCKAGQRGSGAKSASIARRASHRCLGHMLGKVFASNVRRTAVHPRQSPARIGSRNSVASTRGY